MFAQYSWGRISLPIAGRSTELLDYFTRVQEMDPENTSVAEQIKNLEVSKKEQEAINGKNMNSLFISYYILY